MFRREPTQTVPAAFAVELIKENNQLHAALYGELVTAFQAGQRDMVREMQRSNSQLVKELRNVIYPKDPVELERVFLTEEQEEAQWAFEQGLISKDDYAAAMADPIEVDLSFD